MTKEAGNEPRVRTVTATRYVTPLRQGGSLPAIVEADDDGLYVVKFRAAAQGVRTLVAELLAGEIARALGLLVPEIVFVDLDPVLGRSEPDPEIQPLIVNSAGRNVGLDYLPGAIAYHPIATPPDPLFASLVVWLDAYVTNVDRTVRNPNLLLWHKRIWLIDHGAAFYFQYSWDGSPEQALTRARDPFPQIARHCLLPYATALPEADATATTRLSPDVLRAIVEQIPEDWLGEPGFPPPAQHAGSSPPPGLRRTTRTDAALSSAALTRRRPPPPSQHRAAYLSYLTERLRAPREFVQRAEQERRALSA